MLWKPPKRRILTVLRGQERTPHLAVSQKGGGRGGEEGRAGQGGAVCVWGEETGLEEGEERREEACERMDASDIAIPLTGANR